MAEKRRSKSCMGWITKKVIIHYRTGKPMRRRDGKNFVIPIRRRKPK